MKQIKQKVKELIKLLKPLEKIEGKKYESEDAGVEMMNIIKELFPLNRSILGPDYRRSLNFFYKRHKEFKKIRFNSGKKIFDWVVPDEWIIKNGYIEGKDGKRYACFTDSNLSVVSYSTSINKIISKDELFSHVHSLPEQPDAIPYVTTYYKRDWGFCMAEEERIKMKDEFYKVKIDAEHRKGYLEILECKIKGQLKKEIFFSTYLCHPSMANNELSGPALMDAIIKICGRKEEQIYVQIRNTP